MLFEKTFGSNGVHPEDYKYLTCQKKIESAYVPNIAYVPIIQHIGSPAKIIVEIGQKVEEGQLIASAEGFVSVNVHSPIPGKIVGFEERYISIGRKSKVIVIELDGEFKKTGKTFTNVDYNNFSKEYILKAIRESGVVGLGGATFPTHVKLSIPDGKKADTLIINGTECEPFITCDHRLMLDRSEDLLDGVNIINKVIDAQNVYIGIESNKKDAIQKLKSLCKNKYKIKIIPLAVKYPQGDEKQLIKAITGRVVPVDKLPVDCGVVVLNVSSTIAIKEAVVYEKPLIDRVVTITGNGIVNPKNLKVKIGTLVKDLIEECGGLKPNVKKIIIGGPMMGFSQMNLETPITKGCSAVIALTDEDSKDFEQNAICISCGKCINACAFGLMPTILNKYIKNKLYEKALDSGLMFCKECGACSWVCPARIPLVQIFRMGKDISKKLILSKGK
ncbi:MAG: electron transporter RnfC [Spirochaetes bacterium GWD1_27_9]|nr:MAG: electron transporter RnfC [Spirochaetes bacterium GWB1_27_13]OHD25107.1 MAG: electron transporter RnfC [Spirochaetes bacterium GWC1_27_15]OHD39133.1 MAG: electron transporter RnfC [Spirochaetes bacterium GWD1_27_9]